MHARKNEPVSVAPEQADVFGHHLTATLVGWSHCKPLGCISASMGKLVFMLEGLCCSAAC